LLGLPVPRQAWNAVGCPECHQLGYVGRTGVFEVWRVTEDAYQLILKHTDEHTLRESQVAAGHRPLLVDGLAIAAKGITSLDEVRILGSCYVPPPDTTAAQRVRESLGCRSPKRKREAALV
jgi:general secretion pathway protein E